MKATLAALGAHPGLPLPRLGAVLSPELLEVVVRAGLGPLDLPAAYLHVAVTARMQIGVAMQVVRGVLAELALRMGTQGSAALATALPREWGELVMDPTAPDLHAHVAREGRPLADDPPDSERSAG